VRGGEHLRLVDFRNERPPHRLPPPDGAREDGQRLPRRKDSLAPIVEAERRSRRILIEGGSGCRRLDLQIRGEDRRWHPQVGRETGVGAKEPVGADGVRLARLAHARGLRDEIAHRVDRNLEGDRTDDGLTVEDRCRDEARGCLVRGRVGLEVAERDRVGPALRERRVDHPGKSGRRQRATGEGRTEIDLLEDGVDDAPARRIDEKHVIHAVALEEPAECGVHVRMNGGVRGVVTCRVEQVLRSGRILIAGDVERLEPDGDVVQRVEQGLDDGRTPAPLVEFGRQAPGVLRGHGPPVRRRFILRARRCDRRVEGTQRRERRAVTRGHQEFVPERGEEVLHRLRSDRPHHFEPGERLVLQGTRPRPVHHEGSQGQRRQGEQEQRQEDEQAQRRLGLMHGRMTGRAEGWQGDRVRTQSI